MTVAVPSGSTAWAAMPTTVPVAAFSATWLGAASTSATAPTGASFTSARAIVKLALAVDPSDEVANTLIWWLAAAS